MILTACCRDTQNEDLSYNLQIKHSDFKICVFFKNKKGSQSTVEKNSTVSRLKLSKVYVLNLCLFLISLVCILLYKNMFFFRLNISSSFVMLLLFKLTWKVSELHSQWNRHLCAWRHKAFISSRIHLVLIFHQFSFEFSFVWKIRR